MLLLHNAGNRDNMVTILLDHRGQEYLNHEKVAVSVDVEYTTNLLFSLSEEGSADSCICTTNQGRRVFKFSPDQTGYSTNFCRLANIDLTTEYICSYDLVRVRFSALTGKKLTYEVAAKGGGGRM